MEGTGKSESTGSLGDVMKESASAALSFIRSHAAARHIDQIFIRKRHPHSRAGGRSAEGRSFGGRNAGDCARFGFVGSTSTSPRFAMTGEITLRGRVLPIGGLSEKSMAAYRSGVKTVVIPGRMCRTLRRSIPVVKAGVEFVPVSELMTVFRRRATNHSGGADARRRKNLLDPVPHINPRQQPALRSEAARFLENSCMQRNLRRLDRPRDGLLHRSAQLPACTTPEVAFAGRNQTSENLR